MSYTREIAPHIHAIGISDRRLERFENLFPLPNGVTYNSYLITGEVNILMDTVDQSVIRPFLENIETLLQGQPLHYLLITHMEPDHCSAIDLLVQRYPNLRLVGNAKTFQLLEQFYPSNYSENYHLIKNNDELSLGEYTFQFIFAPMVHWPEVMFIYEKSNKILFSADAFGTFGASNGHIFADESNFEHDYLDEMRRYYCNIVGKYGAQVQTVMKKVDALNISMLCPLHGPVWRKNFDLLIQKHTAWSTYEPETNGVVIVCGSMYGNTEEVALSLANKLSQRGVHSIQVYDVSKTDASYIIADIFQYSHIVFAAPTYNMGLYYPMNSLMEEMAALGMKNRDFSLIGNSSWAPMTSINIMKEKLEGMNDMRLVGQPFQILSAMKEDQIAEFNALADAIATSIQSK